MAALWWGGTGGAPLNHCCQLPEFSAAQFKKGGRKITKSKFRAAFEVLNIFEISRNLEIQKYLDKYSLLNYRIR
jgi:hypothetical protein